VFWKKIQNQGALKTILPPVLLPHQNQIYSETMSFSIKSQSFHLHSGGVSSFTTQAMYWRGSFRTFIMHENGPNLTENRIEYVLLTSRDGNFIFFSTNWLGPGSASSQKLTWNGFTEWNLHRNKEKAYRYQIRKQIWLCGGGNFTPSTQPNLFPILALSTALKFRPKFSENEAFSTKNSKSVTMQSLLKESFGHCW